MDDAASSDCGSLNDDDWSAFVAVETEQKTLAVQHKEVVKKLKESGYKGKMIVEPAHQDIRAWTKFMSNFASPVYRTKLWSDDDLGFFKGRTYSPSYIVGGYSPDTGTEETDWRFWSGIRLE